MIQPLAVSNDSQTSKIFTQGICHQKLSAMLMVQNLYKQGKSMRDIALNLQYLVIFKNVRDVSLISTLVRQMGCPHLITAYRKVTAEAYQPLVVDLRPETPEYLRIRSHMFPNQTMKIYMKKDTFAMSLREKNLDHMY